MKINSPADGRIVVELSEQDMLELDITYESMDYSTIETRRVIWTVLDEAEKTLGCELDPSKKMIIEASPCAEGGCVLCFTMLEERKKPFSRKHTLRKLPDGFICDFENLDNLFSAAEVLGTDRKDVKCSLFELDGSYRMIVASGDEGTGNRLSEFCRIRTCSRLQNDFTNEHWNCLARDNAVELLLNGRRTHRQEP